MESPYAVELIDVYKSFPGVKALSAVSLAVKAGEVHALLGENGAGKSTLLKILSGVYIPDRGIVKLEGKEIRPASPSHAHHMGISLVHQELQQVPELSVAENLFLAQEIHYPGRIVINRRRSAVLAAELLARIGVTIDARAKIKTLGIAERQMIEIAKALWGKAKVIAFDEPTSSLSKAEVNQLFRVIKELKEKGVGIIYVSHRLEEIGAIADTISILRDGQNIISGPASEFDEARMVKSMVGRDLSSLPQRADIAGNKVAEDSGNRRIVLQARGLTNRRLKDVSFSLYQGEILGVAGLVGSGRTELMRAVYGADEALGKVEILGRDMAKRSPQKSIKAGLGLIPEDRKGQAILRLMSIKNNIVISSLKNAERFGLLSGRKMSQAVAAFFDRLMIRPRDPEMVIANLSGGNQQKAVVARSLLANSSVLIFDEPTRGIDIGAKADIYTLMRELVAQGKSIMMVSSELPEILLMSDRIIVMKEGRITGELSRSEADEERIMQYATGGN
ncbi:MAG: sugar ABC transporter ATP-binding protein [Treponema sp.]|nr:sugar ABC transporter ATP-binding protein [Treponema sp.]